MEAVPLPDSLLHQKEVVRLERQRAAYDLECERNEERANAWADLKAACQYQLPAEFVAACDWEMPDWWGTASVGTYRTVTAHWEGHRPIHVNLTRSANSWLAPTKDGQVAPCYRVEDGGDHADLVSALLEAELH